MEIKRPKLIYISLEKYVISDMLGGKQHIEGILYALQPHFEVFFYGIDATEISAQCEKISLNKKMFYRQIFKVLWAANGQKVLFRKTLIGMYFCCLVKILMFLFHRKIFMYFEYNGISGDFSVSNRFLSKVLLYANVVPAILFSGIYAVNENIAMRIKRYAKIASCSVTVGENGCFPMAEESSKLVHENWSREVCGLDRKNSRLDLYFFGAKQEKYHLRMLVEEVGALIPGSVTLHLVGNGFEEFEHFVSVKAVGPLTPPEFTRYVSATRGDNAWGIIPLNKFNAGADVVPIKAMDYLTAGLPLLHSTACLSKFPISAAVQSYSAESGQALNEALRKLQTYSHKDMDDVRLTVYDLAASHSWRKKLRPVINMLMA